MKYLLGIFTALSALATVCILIAFIWVFIMWLGGGFNVVLPGPGLIISGSLVLVALFIVGVSMFLLTVLLARKIFKPLALK
jgi:hypothetical protein